MTTERDFYRHWKKATPMTPNTKESKMAPETLRNMIDTYSRATLIAASALRQAGSTNGTISMNLGIDESVVENCIQAGTELRGIAARQQDFEDRIIDRGDGHPFPERATGAGDRYWGPEYR